MSTTHPGKTMKDNREPTLPFDFVSEANLERQDLNHDYGTGGFYGRPIDLITERSETPHSFLGHGAGTVSSRAASRDASPSGTLRYPFSSVGLADNGGTTYPSQYHHPGPLQPSPYGHHYQAVESETNLLHGAAPLAGEHSRPSTGHRTISNETGYGTTWRSAGGGYGRVPQQEDIGAYEEYRRGRR
jgi:hypothetical protein